VDIDVDGLSALHEELSHAFVVLSGHVHEGIVKLDADEWVVAEHVDVVFPDHEVGSDVLLVDSSTCVGEDYVFTANGPDDSDRKRNLIHRESCIKVISALHNEVPFFVEGAQDESVGVALDGLGGHVPALDFVVG